MCRESPRAAEHLRRSPQPGVGRGLGGHRPGPPSVSPGPPPESSADTAGSVGTPQINIHAGVNGWEGAGGRTG